MSRHWLLALVLVACACGTPVAATPSPDPGHLVTAAERADDALRTAFAAADAGPLEGVLAGRALMVARRQLAQEARTGVRRDEQLETRREVHESASAAHAEVVLLIKARQRVVRAGAADPPYTTVLRQWRATLALQNGRWVVVDDGDLGPSQWWPS